MRTGKFEVASAVLVFLSGGGSAGVVGDAGTAKSKCTNDLYSAARTGCPAECSAHGLCWSTFDAAALEWSADPICHCEDWFGGEACAFRDLTTLELAPVLVDFVPPINEVDMRVVFEADGIEITANGTEILPEQTRNKPNITVPKPPAGAEFTYTLVVANPGETRTPWGSQR